MGLILAAMSAAGSAFADTWKEYFYCDAIPADTICVKAHKKVRGFSSNHGSTANAAFTDYGQKQIASDVVSYLKNDNYYDGFQKFVTDCDQYLKAQQAGTPVDTWIPDSSYDEAAHQQTMSYIRYGVTFAGAPLIALIVCLIIKAKNKTAGIKYEAQNYVPKNGVNVTGMQDIFLYRTETVTHINRDHGGGGGHFGGTSINSGGFSGTSGHF